MLVQSIPVKTLPYAFVNEGVREAKIGELWVTIESVEVFKDRLIINDGTATFRLWYVSPGLGGAMKEVVVR